MKRTYTLLVVALLLASTLMAMLGFPPTVNAVEMHSPVPVRVNANVKESLSIAASEDGRIYTVWSERISDNTDVYLSYSSNNGSSFSPAMRVNADSAGSQRGSQAAISGNILYVVWEDGRQDSGDIILARSEDGGLTFEEVHVSDFEDGTQSNPTVAAAGDRVAVAWEEYRSDNTIRIWNGGDGALVREMAGHSGAVRAVELSPSGAYLASGSEDSTVRIWNAATGALLRNITSHSRAVTAVNWSADGAMLATGSFDHNVTLFDTTDFSVVTKLNSTGGVPTKNFVNAVTFSPNGSQVAVAYNGRYGTDAPSGLPTQYFNLTVWNASDWSSWTRNELTPEADDSFFTNSVMDLAFSHGGAYLAAGSKAGVKKVGDTVTDTGLTLRIWDSATSQIVSSVKLDRPVHSVAWSPDDSHIAAGLANGSIAVVNMSNPADIHWMLGTHTGAVNSIDWSAVENELASGASDPTAKVWWDSGSIRYGTERLNISGHMNSVYSVDWSSNGQLLATAGGTSGQYGMGENQIFCAVSDDGGQSFSSPVLVADSCARNRLRPKAAIAPSGEVSIVWYDSRSGGNQIYFANSTDGASFGMNFGVDTLSTECVIPDIFVDGAGTAHIVWQYGLGAGIRYSNSSDGFFTNQIIAATAQIPHVSGSPGGSSVWVTWRHKDAANVSHIKASISFDGGANFQAESSSLNYTSSTIGEHAIFTDRYNQTYAAWEIGESIYHRTTVMADEWPPTVLSSSPADGETDVSIFTSFTIRFSEPMNRTATEMAFSWTDGTSLWQVGDCEGNQGEWNAYGDSVSFTPRTPLQYQKSGYSFTIASSAKDLAGNILGSDFTWAFTTSADTDPPLIEHHPSQATVSYDEPYNVMAIIRDQWGTVATAALHYRFVGDAAPVNNSVEMELSGTTYGAAIPPQQALGTIYYYISATDSFGNIGHSPAGYTNQSQLYSVSVIDGVEPTISHVPVTEADVFRSIEIWAVVADHIALQNVSLNYRGILGGYVGVEMQPVNGTPNTFSHLIPAQGSTGIVHYNITATDDSGNFNSTDTFSIQILDRMPPLINSVSHIYLNGSTEVLIRANVTDDVEMGTVKLYFKAFGSDRWVERPMTHVGGDIYEWKIPAQPKSGNVTVYYYVNATDAAGNAASTLADQDLFEVELVGTGADYTLYYWGLGGVLVVLFLFLVYLLIRRGKLAHSPDSETPVERKDAAPPRSSESGGAVPEEIDPESPGESAPEKVDEGP